MVCFPCVQWLLRPTIGPSEAGQLSECSYAKTPIATNDMNFLVFNIKVCIVIIIIIFPSGPSIELTMPFT